jgi:putative membrane protein insertion efficiency factor
MVFIKIYQFLFSFDHGIPSKLFPGRRICRMYPSCSQYFYEAVKRYGSIKGTFLGMKRIVKCGPWTEFGTYDPVP